MLVASSRSLFKSLYSWKPQESWKQKMTKYSKYYKFIWRDSLFPPRWRIKMFKKLIFNPIIIGKFHPKPDWHRASREGTRKYNQYNSVIGSQFCPKTCSLMASRQDFCQLMFSVRLLWSELNKLFSFIAADSEQYYTESKVLHVFTNRCFDLSPGLPEICTCTVQHYRSSQRKTKGIFV